MVNLKQLKKEPSLSENDGSIMRNDGSDGSPSCFSALGSPKRRRHNERSSGGMCCVILTG